jgi:hypothetical protein
MLGSAKKVLKKFTRGLGYNLVPIHIIPMDFRQMGNFIYLARMFEKIREANGSVVECGVGRGRTFLDFAYLISKEGKGRMLWGFDSFAGFPEPAVEDQGPRNPKRGEWSGTSPEDVVRILERAGMDRSSINKQIKVVPGFLEESLRKYDGGKIALLHIDVDLYEAYRTALNELFPQVTEGGLILFDEYGHTNWPGAKKAVDEYFKDKPYRIEHDLFSDKYFVVKRNEKAD